jgi:hypothetical protein
MGMSLRVECFYDDEAHNWHFQGPALNIIGGGQATRQEAERACLDAIEYALQGNANDYDRDALAVTLTVDIHAA